MRVAYQNTANYVAQVRNVVHVGQSTGNENVILPRLGEGRFPRCWHSECDYWNCCDCQTRCAVLVLGQV